jgi:DMSO reductase anchor subunit
MNGHKHSLSSLITGKSVFFYGFKDEVINKLYKYLIVFGVVGAIFQAFAPKVAVYLIVEIYLIVISSVILKVRFSSATQEKTLKPEYTIRQVSWVIYYMLGICCFMFTIVARQIINVM